MDDAVDCVTRFVVVVFFFFPVSLLSGGECSGVSEKGSWLDMVATSGVAVTVVLVSGVVVSAWLGSAAGCWCECALVAVLDLIVPA